MRKLYLTRTGPEADAMRRSGLNALPVFASPKGQRWDEIEVAFRIDDPIPYQEEESDVGRKNAEEIRIRERMALQKSWPCCLRDATTRIVNT